jgi:hypothetical protein
MRKGWRLAILGLAIAAVICAPRKCSAEARCPWLNAATAAGVLGGDVQMTVTAPMDPGAGKGVGTAMYPDQVRSDRFDVSCEFTRNVDNSTYSLSIVVKTMSDAAKDFAPFLNLCAGSTVALKGVGNEAVQCVLRDASQEGEEKVIGRVRDRAFVLTIHREVKSHNSPNGQELSDKARNVAEQVAGSLF